MLGMSSLAVLQPRPRLRGRTAVLAIDIICGGHLEGRSARDLEPRSRLAPERL